MINLLWSDFARMCEAIQNRNLVTEKESILKSSKLTDEAKEILSLNLESNFIKDKKAIIWIAKIYEVLSEDISLQIKIHGEIGEGIKWYVENSNKSDYTIKQIKHLLEMDCSKIKKDLGDGFITCAFKVNKRFSDFLETNGGEKMSESEYKKDKLIFYKF